MTDPSQPSPPPYAGQGYPAPPAGYPAPPTGSPAPPTGYPAPPTGYPAPSGRVQAPARRAATVIALCLAGALVLLMLGDFVAYLLTFRDFESYSIRSLVLGSLNLLLGVGAVVSAGIALAARPESPVLPGIAFGIGVVSIVSSLLTAFGSLGDGLRYLLSGS